MYTVSFLWMVFDQFNNINASKYEKSRALTYKTMALIAEDKLK